LVIVIQAYLAPSSSFLLFRLFHDLFHVLFLSYSHHTKEVVYCFARLGCTCLDFAVRMSRDVVKGEFIEFILSSSFGLVVRGDDAVYLGCSLLA
jgi:hypothetical protein